MKEYLNEKEAALLKRLEKEYKETLSVVLFPPQDLFDDATMNQLLAALCVRGYLLANPLTTQLRMSQAQIVLSEKALNRFNQESEH